MHKYVTGVQKPRRHMEEARAHMASLMRQRDLIENSILSSIKEHEGLGIGLKDSLLDSQGFPRAELDLYQIRSLRNSIARKIRFDTFHKVLKH